jgi:hypothetical protein
VDKDHDPMWFFDEQPENYKTFRNEAQALEKEYLELRKLLAEAENSLKNEPDNENFQAKVSYLTGRIKSLEEKAPWLTSGLMVEYALWGTPH